MESPKKETPSTYQVGKKPAADPALQGGDVEIPGTESDSPPPGIRPREKSGDHHKTKGNSASHPQESAAATPKT